MTRPLTKRELAFAATPLVRMPSGRTRRNASVSQSVFANDAFGIFTLISAQSASVTAALIFVLVSSFKFVALTIAVAVGLVACSNRRALD